MTTLNYVTLTGSLGAAGARGSVTLTPSGWLTDSADELLIPPEPQGIILPAAGTFSVSLLATDNPAPQPQGWTWAASIQLPGISAYGFSFALPAGPLSFTAAGAAPCVFTAPGSSLAAGTGVRLSGGSLPGGFASGITYYVVSPSGDTFGLAATAGGSPLGSTSSGSGSVLTVSTDISSVAAAEPASQYQAYMPLPSGSPSSGLVPAATGSGNASTWSAASALGALLAANNLSDLAARQTALNNLAGAVTSGDFLRGNGSNVSMAPVQSGDLPAGTTSAKGALQLDGTASDIQPAQQSASAGSSGKAADSGHAHPPGSAFLAVSQYAPASRTTLTANTTSLAAFSSASVNTGSFTAPASGSVVVTASFVAQTGTGSTQLAVALAGHGTTTVAGYAYEFESSSTANLLPLSIPFLVTGLTPGNTYNFDLMGSAQSGDAWSIFATGTQSPPVTSGNTGGPVLMTVQAV
jgi:hypothetical protein